MNKIKTVKEANEYLEKAFEAHVPASGKAKTMYGEIVRAINRIGYRYLNDGDHIGVGYGRETCNPAARFLTNVCDSAVTTAIVNAWNVYSDDEYEARLNAAYIEVSNYLENNKEALLTKESEDMFSYYDKTEDYDDSYDDEEEEYYDEDEYDDEEYED